MRRSAVNVLVRYLGKLDCSHGVLITQPSHWSGRVDPEVDGGRTGNKKASNEEINWGFSEKEREMNYYLRIT